MMKNKEAADEYVEAKTVVWWDMDNCPIPDGYDPLCVGPSIDSALMKLGYKGPLTIIAVGNLNATSSDVLEALSSTGIVIKHARNGRCSFGCDVIECTRGNDPPATVMVITDPLGVNIFSLAIIPREGKSKLNMLVAYSPPKDCSGQKLDSDNQLPSAEWLWTVDSLLKVSSTHETRRQDKFSDTMFHCIPCLFKAQSLEDFTDHFSHDLHFMHGGDMPTPKGMVESQVPSYEYDAEDPRSNSGWETMTKKEFLRAEADAKRREWEKRMEGERERERAMEKPKAKIKGRKGKYISFSALLKVRAKNQSKAKAKKKKLKVERED